MKKRHITNKSKINVIICFILKLLVILSAINQGLQKNLVNVLLCVLTLLLFKLLDFVTKDFKIKLPNTLVVIVYIFIFSANILGEVQNFYGIFPEWDTMLHIINGFICAAVGFSLIDIMNSKSISINPIFITIVAFCFSMTMGVFWEFIEFSIDHYLNLDMQKDQTINKISSVYLNINKENNPIKINNINKTIIYTNKDNYIIEDGYLDIGLGDTIKDLFVNFIGALIFSFIGYSYIKNKEKHLFLEMFIPKKV